jgi:hypothetical protein
MNWRNWSSEVSNMGLSGGTQHGGYTRFQLPRLIGSAAAGSSTTELKGTVGWTTWVTRYFESW